MHVSVLYNELIDSLNIKPDGVYVDCTGGGGGHASLALEKLSENGKLIVLDRDLEAVNRLNEKFQGDNRVEVIHGNFQELDYILKALGIQKVDGIYADFGVSSFQLQTAERGFSFRLDGPLDMRMDTSKGEPISAMINNDTESNIATVIRKYGEEKFYKNIAKAIVQRRVVKPFETTSDLADVVKGAIPKKFHKKGINPATQTFQAFRIYANEELSAIDMLLSKIGNMLNKGGRFAAISFHSLEDRIVKDALNKYAKPCTCPPSFPVCVCNAVAEFKIITKKPIVPTEEEIKKNPLSRSAKLRVGEKL